MGLKTIPYQRLVAAEVGLVASGTTDQNGVWSAEFSVGDYLTSKGFTAPSGTTGILIHVVNADTSNRWAGIKAKGKTEPYLLFDTVARRVIDIVVPYTDATASFSFYAENITNVQFYVKAFVDDSFVIADSSAFPNLPNTKSNWRTVTVTEAEPSSILLPRVTFPLSRPTGLSSYTWLISASSAVRSYGVLDSNKQFDLFTVALTQYAGHARNFNAFAPRAINFTAPAADATWKTAPVSYPGKSAVLIEVDYNSVSIPAFFRSKGATQYNPNLTQFHANHRMIVPLDNNGEFEYAVGTTWVLSTPITVVGTFDEIGAEPALIDFPPIVKPNDTIDLTGKISGFGGTLTQVTLTDAQGNSIVVPVVSGFTVTIPDLGAGQVASIQFGSCTVTATVGAKTATDTFSYEPKAGFDVVTIDIPFSGSGNISNGWPQPLVSGDQVYFPTANNTIVYDDARFSTDNLGLWNAHAIYLDGVAEQFTIDTTPVFPPPEGNSGLSAIGLTSVSPTATGLTARGL